VNRRSSDLLRETVLSLGVPLDIVDQAIADGTLELLALEYTVVAESPEFDLVEVSTQTGLEQAQLRAFWRALGFPDPRPGERVFTASDVDMLADVVRFINDGAFDADLALQMSRVIGSSLARIASALVEAADAQASARSTGQMSPEEVELAAIRSAEILPLMPRIMDRVWRRHLGAAVRRRIVRATADEGQIVCVGFADLVGFTAQTQELPEHQLAEVVGQFETIAYDLTSSHDGRVVKMIGDEVMFMTDDVRSGAELALDMAATYRRAEHLSDVRVGLASGRALERDGDVYGAVVNLASRIVNVAFPGAVVVSPDVHEALQDDPTFVFKSLRSNYLRDIGRMRLWAMRSTDDEFEQPFRAERRRRSARNTFNLGMTARPVLEQFGEALTPAKRRRDGGVADYDNEPTTGQLAAITDAVLEADMDEDLQVEMLADIDSSRRLRQLEDDAHRRADLLDLEAEKRVAEAEDEARRKVEEVEADAHRRIEGVLLEAEEKSRKANDQADRKLAQVAETADRKAEATKRDARRKAKRKASRKKRDKKRDEDRDKDRDGRAD
jgi:adenylate cyclase